MTTHQRLFRVIALVSGITAILGGMSLVLAGSLGWGAAVVATGVMGFVWLTRAMQGSDVSGDAAHAPVRILPAPQLDAATPLFELPAEGNPQPQSPTQQMSTSGWSRAIRWLRQAPQLQLLSALAVGIVLGILVDRMLLRETTGPNLAAANGRSANIISSLISNISPNTSSDKSAQTRVVIEGKPIDVRASELDMGRIEEIFDGNVSTLMRGKSANPFIIELNYMEPRDVALVSISLASMENTEIKLIATKPNNEQVTTQLQWREVRVEPTLELELPGGPHKVIALRIEILDRRPPPGEGFHTHVRELRVQ